MKQVAKVLKIVGTAIVDDLRPSNLWPDPYYRIAAATGGATLVVVQVYQHGPKVLGYVEVMFATMYINFGG